MCSVAHRAGRGCWELKPVRVWGESWAFSWCDCLASTGCQLFSRPRLASSLFRPLLFITWSFVCRAFAMTLTLAKMVLMVQRCNVLQKNGTTMAGYD